MTNVDTLRFLIDQANRMDDDTPKKVRRHMVDMLASAVRKAVGEDLAVTGHEGRSDDSWRWWQIQVMKSTGYPRVVWLQSRELYGTGSFNWISADWPDAAETLLEAAEWVARGDTPEVASIRAKRKAEQAPSPSFEELVTQAGGRVIDDETDVLAVWPTGATLVDAGGKMRVYSADGVEVFRNLEGAHNRLVEATGARLVRHGLAVNAVWPDGTYLHEVSGGWWVFFADGTERYHEDLAAALACEGKCEE